MSTDATQGFDFITNIYEVAIGAGGKNDLRYTRGKPHAGGSVVITEIIYDQHSHITHGVTRVKIYARRANGGKDDFLWRVIQGVPLTITRDINEQE